MDTVLKAPKTTTLTAFSWDGIRGEGYEIHMGETRREGGRPLFEIASKNSMPVSGRDGCMADHGRYMGTYIHGLFDTAAITRKWLAAIGLRDLPADTDGGLPARQKEYEKLAHHFRKHVDLEKVYRLLKESGIDGEDVRNRRLP